VGSLNGTYVNRERIENIRLAGGDEVQIGKYRLVFFAGHAGESAGSDTADSTDGTDSADDSGNVGAANGVP
jgi:pSer/pThr/pTyr-binding forkhead associated (FHA) protein